MKKTLVTLVVMFAFMMTSCGQNEVAVADNSVSIASNLNVNPSSVNKDKPSDLNKSNKANFVRLYEKKVESLSGKHINGEVYGLAEGYTYNKKLYWVILMFTDNDITPYVFKSDMNFSSVSYEKMNKELNLKQYILNKKA